MRRLDKLSPGTGGHWILYDDTSFEWLNVPPEWRNLEVRAIEGIPLDSTADDCATMIGAIFDVEIPVTGLQDLVDSGSFCSGPEHYIDPPVASSRLESFSGNAIPAEESAGNTRPIRFNSELLGGLRLSGQAQGYVLKLRLEVRIRPLPGSDASRLRADIEYTAVDLDVLDSGTIGDLLVAPDTLCVTRLTPAAGADTLNSPDCAVTAP